MSSRWVRRSPKASCSSPWSTRTIVRRSSSSTVCTVAALVLVCLLLSETTSAPCRRAWRFSTVDENIVHTEDVIDRADLEGLEGMEIGMPEIKCVVLPEGPDAIVLKSRRFVIDIISFWTPECAILISQSLSKLEVKRQWQAHSEPKHRKTATQTRGHPPKIYELQDFFFMHFVEAMYMISTEGMNEVEEKLFFVIMYVGTISRKTISIKCDKRQSTTRFSDETERRPKIPKASGLRRPQKRKKKDPESPSASHDWGNHWAKGRLSKRATQRKKQLSRRLQGGMKDDEMMSSSGSGEDSNMRRRQWLRRNTTQWTTRSSLKGKFMMPQEDRKKKWKVHCRKFQVNPMDLRKMKQTNETILQSVGVQLQGMNTTIETLKTSTDKLCSEHEQMHLSSTTNIKTSELKSKKLRKNGWRKLVATIVSSRCGNQTKKGRNDHV